jgi:hypothetical protein
MLSRKYSSWILVALLALNLWLLVFTVAVKPAKAVPDPWEMPVVYIQSIPLSPNVLRVNVAVYNLTNTFWPTNFQRVKGGPLPPSKTGAPVARYYYPLGNLIAFDIAISWNSAVLQYVSHVATVPRGTAPQPFRSRGILDSPLIMQGNVVDPVLGTFRATISSKFPGASFNAPLDAANVCSLTFTVLGVGDYGLSLDRVDLVLDTRFWGRTANIGVQPEIPWRTVLDPYLAHNVGVEAAPRNKDVVGKGKPFDTYALVKNAGDSSETFDVTIYATNATSDYVVGTASTTVPARSAQTVKVACTQPGTGLKKGTYTIKAVVDTVTDEAYTADNELIQGTILVTLSGDVDGNKAVNIFDIVKMAGVYGINTQAHPNYDPYCDLDNDGDIDIFDIVIAAGNYGKSW